MLRSIADMYNVASTRRPCGPVNARSGCRSLLRGSNSRVVPCGIEKQTRSAIGVEVVAVFEAGRLNGAHAVWTSPAERPQLWAGQAAAWSGGTRCPPGPRRRRATEKVPRGSTAHRMARTRPRVRFTRWAVPRRWWRHRRMRPRRSCERARPAVSRRGVRGPAVLQSVLAGHCCL